MNVKAEKAIILKKIEKINDVNLIRAIENMLDYALKKEMKEKDFIEVPKAHQKLVLERFDKVRKDPDRLLDWDKAKKMLKA